MGRMAALVIPHPGLCQRGSLPPPAAQTAIIHRPRGTARGCVPAGRSHARGGQGRQRAGEVRPPWCHRGALQGR